MSVIESVVADSTGYTKMSCYNKTVFPMIRTGQSVMILNGICKPREIVLTSESKVLLIPLVDVGGDIALAAQQLTTQLTNPTAAEQKSVLQILDLPPGSLVTCTVKVIEAEEVQTVTTQYGGETEVRNGVIADHTAAISFAFWRGLAALPIAENDCIKVSGGIVSKTTDGQPKISGNQRTAVEFLPKETVPITKGTTRYEEEGDVIAVSNVMVYTSCTRTACYKKKLQNNECPKCNTKYAAAEQAQSVLCSVAIEQDESLSTVTLFTPQVQELMKGKEFTIEGNSDLEKDILSALPIKVGFTRSPVKDNTTLTTLKKL